jgi:hypothetical protein
VGGHRADDTLALQRRISVLAVGPGFALLPGSAHQAAVAQTGQVPAASSLSYLFGPLVAFAGIGVLSLLLRWAFGRGGSLVAAPPRPGAPSDYGLLVPVVTPRTEAEGESLRRALEEHGLRATLTHTVAGPRLMVFAADEELARAILADR